MLVYKRSDMFTNMDCGDVWKIGSKMEKSEVCGETGYDGGRDTVNQNRMISG